MRLSYQYFVGTARLILIKVLIGSPWFKEKLVRRRGSEISPRACTIYRRPLGVLLPLNFIGGDIQAGMVATLRQHPGGHCHRMASFK